MRTFLFCLILISIFMTGCAAMLGSSTQDIAIQTDHKSDAVFVNGSNQTNRTGSFTITKDFKPIQVIVENDDYRPEQFILMQYKMSGWHFFSWVPWILIAGPVFDYQSASAYSFPSSLSLSYQRIPNIKVESEIKKSLWVDSVTAELTNRNVVTYEHDYSSWVSDPAKGELKRWNSNETFSLTELASNQLNGLLIKKGFANQDNVLLGSKDSRLHISGVLDKVTMHYVNNSISLDKIVYADFEITWKLNDGLGQAIFSNHSTISSGQFVFSFPYFYDAMLNQVFGDGLEKSFSLFMNMQEVKSEIYKESSAAEVSTVKSESIISLNQAKKYVSSLDQAIKSSVTIKGKNGHGSGFIISEDGYIVTNYHVIAGVGAAKVALNNQSEFDFEVVRFDKEIDLALIKISSKGLIPFKLRKDRTVEVAKDVYAVGTPESKSLAQSISKGIISGVRDNGKESRLIQTDASVNSGNSGGALVDKKGIVIAVVSSKLKGLGVEGVAFGIPSYEIFDRLKITQP